MESILAVLGGMSVILVLISIGLYVWSSLMNQKVLKHMGYKNAWMAWIPYANNYAIADVIRGEDGQTDVLGCKIPSVVFNFWWLIAAAVMSVPKVGSIAYIILQILCLGTCYKGIFAACEGKDQKEVGSIAYIAGFMPVIALIKFSLYKFQDKTE